MSDRKNLAFFLIGNPFVYKYYQPFIEKFRKKFFPIILEHSPKPDNNLEKLTADVERILDTHGRIPEQCIIISHSYGGFFAQKLHLMYNFFAAFYITPFLIKPRSWKSHFILSTLGAFSRYPKLAKIVYEKIPNSLYLSMDVDPRKLQFEKFDIMPMIKTCAWEKQNICQVDKLPLLKPRSYLIHALEDIWCDENTFNCWPAYQKLILPIKHGFVLYKQEYIVAKEILYIINKLQKSN